MTTLEEEYQEIMELYKNDRGDHCEVLSLLTRYREALAKERERTLEEFISESLLGAIRSDMSDDYSDRIDPSLLEEISLTAYNAVKWEKIYLIEQLKGTGHD